MTSAAAVTSATAATSIVIEPVDLAIVQDAVARYLPPDAEVWVYGSRATGRRIWRGSDLDLMIKAPARLGFSGLADLQEALSESPVPFMADLHDWHDTSPEFLARIAPDMVRLPMPGDAPQAARRAA